MVNVDGQMQSYVPLDTQQVFLRLNRTLLVLLGLKTADMQ